MFFFLLPRYDYSTLLLIARMKVQFETVESQQRFENKAVTLSLLVLGFVPGPVSPQCLLPQGYWKLYIWNVGNKTFERLKKTSFAYAHPEKKAWICKVQHRFMTVTLIDTALIF